MCMGGGSPAPPAPPAPPTPAPEMQDAGVVDARDKEIRRRRAVTSNTILTSPQGATGKATTATKTLLGA